MRLFILGLLLGTFGSALLDRLREPKIEARRDWPPMMVASPLVEPTPTRPPSIREDSDDLAHLTREQLYRRAQAAGIAGRSQMSKAELIAALRASSG
jgi:hypothetical protein